MAGLIPDAFRDEVLSRTDIVELIDSHVPLKKQGNSHTACCPFHSEKTPSFNVIGKKQFYHCFGCGASGNAISFIMQHLGLGFREAIEHLAQRAGLTLPDTVDTRTPKTSGLYALMKTVCTFYQKQLRESADTAIAYLQRRGVSGEIAKRYQLGFAPEGWHLLERAFARQKKELIETGMLVVRDDGKTCDRYRQRIMFPIHDRQGRITGFGGRAVAEGQKPKYLNSPETPLFQKSRELYGLYQVLQRPEMPEYIIVVEGYLDVLALAQHGFDNAVATLGTATSTWHIQILSRHTRRIIFCFDGDAAGRQAAWRALENSLAHLDTGLEIGFVFLPEGEDPDSLVRREGFEAFGARLRAFQALNHFFFETLSANIDLSSLSGKARLVHVVKPYLMKMPDGPYRQLLEDELGRKTRIEGHRLHPMIGDGAEKPAPVTQKAIRRSPARLAIALLLQHPEIFAECREYIQEGSLQGNSLALLRELLDVLSHTPQPTTASLVEHWRNTPWFDVVSRLAVWEHLVPQDARAREFIDIVQFLHKQDVEKNIQQLLVKSRTNGLDATERETLQRLLRSRHPAGS
ncbi:DNA primase [Legionella geestiana]|uniref:DNA primase n=1 Tax=Legionella geestiana TaxID=45065 RepID=UPI001091C77F|nr:DNA primase [Legionella geestiana]QDQ39432.1 DNA primase [Legionella geestiana]